MSNTIVFTFKKTKTLLAQPTHNSSIGAINLVYYGSKTHYDTLELQQNCSQDQIRQSFVKLSKLHHPDKGKTRTGERFQQIMEAYKVLGKPDTRRMYDQSLQFNYSYENVINVERDGQVFRPNQYGFADPRTYPRRSSPYYGFDAIKGRISNKMIVTCCFIFGGIGFAIQLYAIRNSFTFKRSILDEKSAEISRMHAKVRAEAEKFNNHEQLERFKTRIGDVEEK